MTPESNATGKGRATGPFPFPRAALVLAALFIVAMVLHAFWWQRQAVVHDFGGYAMGSTWSARVTGPRNLDRAFVQAGLEGELQRLDQQLSGYREGTGLSIVNQSAIGEWIALPADLARVLAFGLELWRESDGAFDMTVRPLVLLWGFGAGEPRTSLPGDAEIADALRRLGSGEVEFQARPAQLRRRSEVSLDVDAIAPGHAADVLAAWLVREGLTSHLVEVGGELFASGRRPDGQAWHVGIERPLLARGELQQVIAVSDVGVATSGDYRDYFEIGGVRYSHTLNPATGRPVNHALASVTVLAPTALAADGYATAILVLGPEQGMAFAEARRLPVFMLLRETDGRIIERYNQHFAPYLAGED